MNKKYIFGLTLILILTSFLFNIDKQISQQLSILNTDIKNSYISKIIYLEEFFSKYFDQAQQIEILQKKVLENEQSKISYLLNKQKEQNDFNSSINRLEVISYIDFNDFSKVLLKSSHLPNSVKPLITNDGYSAGITAIYNNKLIGYLNHNAKCNYAVYIGKNLAPGITFGDERKGSITIKYIPIWQNINIGDEVITSGMDDIFNKGIKVGKVISIKKLSNTQEAKVNPYANVYNKEYFYTVLDDNNLSK